MGEHNERADQGLTRRELLRKGAVLGGTLAWSIPTVQTFRMAPAFAAATSHAVSYVAFVLECDGKYYRAKYDVGGGWSTGNQKLPCQAGSFASWPSEYTYTNGPPPSGLSNPTGGSTLTFNFGSCNVVWSVNKCGQTCEVQSGERLSFSPCQGQVN